MATSSPLCLICGQVFSGTVERTRHQAAEHPGQRVAWHAKLPYIVGADGTETKIRPSAVKRMRLAARAAAGLESPGRARPAKPERKGPAQGATPKPAGPDQEPPAPSVQVPLPDSPEAPPYFVQEQPPHFSFGAPVGPAPTGPTGEPLAPTGPGRAQLRLELNQGLLAEMIRNLSIVASDWDGAGPAGHFSHTEAAQLAMLLHEPTLDLVDRYFAGNVNRFRLGMAAVVIFLGKGRIHFRAIQARRLQAVEGGQEDQEQAARAAQAITEPLAVDPTAPPSLDELAARQAAAREAAQPSAGGPRWRPDMSPEELAELQAAQAERA